MFSSSNCGDRDLVNVWMIVYVLAIENKTNTYFALVPGLHFSAVLIDDALILGSDLLHDAGHVLLRCGVNLNVYAAGGHLSAKSCEFLQNNNIAVSLCTFSYIAHLLRNGLF